MQFRSEDAPDGITAITHRRRIKAFLAVLLLVPALAAAAPDDLLRPHRGAVTYVDFWASWCTPCAQSFPWLNAMQAKYGPRGLRVVGVGVDADTTKGERFLQRHPAQFAIVADPKGVLAEHFGVQGMPYSLLLDASGKVLHRHIGYRADEAAEYEQAIQAALTAQGATP